MFINRLMDNFHVRLIFGHGRFVLGAVFVTIFGAHIYKICIHRQHHVIMSKIRILIGQLAGISKRNKKTYTVSTRSFLWSLVSNSATKTYNTRESEGILLTHVIISSANRSHLRQAQTPVKYRINMKLKTVHNSGAYDIKLPKSRCTRKMH